MPMSQLRASECMAEERAAHRATHRCAHMHRLVKIHEARNTLKHTKLCFLCNYKLVPRLSRVILFIEVIII